MNIKRTALTVLLFLLSQQASMAVAALIHCAHNDVQVSAITAPIPASTEAAKTVQAGEPTAVQSHDQHCGREASDSMDMERYPTKANASADCCSFDCDCCIASCQSVLAALDFPVILAVSRHTHFFYAVMAPRTSQQNLLRPPISV